MESYRQDYPLIKIIFYPIRRSAESTFKMKSLTFLFVFLFYFSTPIWALVLYQWVDKQGHIHIVDDPSKIPPPYRDKAKVLEFLPSASKSPPKRVEAGPPEPTKDIYGRDLKWYLEQKKYWLKQAEILQKQIKENERVMQLLHRGVPKARRGVRTPYGLQLGKGPLLRRWAEYKRLQRLNKILAQKLKKARYMSQKGILRQAAKAQAPSSWLEAIRNDP